MVTEVSYIVKVSIWWDYAFGPYVYELSFETQEDAQILFDLFYLVNNDTFLYKFSDYNEHLLAVISKYHEWPYSSLDILPIVKRVITEEVIEK